MLGIRGVVIGKKSPGVGCIACNNRRMKRLVLVVIAILVLGAGVHYYYKQSTRIMLVATPSRGALSNVTEKGEPMYPSMRVDFDVKNYEPQGGEIVTFGDDGKTALGYTTPTNTRHDFHEPGTYTVKLEYKGAILAETKVVVLPLSR